MKTPPSCQNQKFGHNFPYPGANCLNCGIGQYELNKTGRGRKKNGDLRESLGKRLAEKGKFLHSKEHLLADEISRYFREEKRFGMYIGVIKRIGFNAAYGAFSEVKQSKIPEKDKVKLFMWKVKQLKPEKSLS